MRVENHARRVAFLLLFSSAVIPTAANETPEEEMARKGAELISRGQRDLEKENWQRAAKYFREADRLLDGKSPAALVPLVEISFRLEEFEDSIAYAKRIISLTELKQLNIFAHQYMGLSLVRKATNAMTADTIRSGKRPLPETDSHESLEGAVAEFRKALELAGGGGKAVRIHLAEALFFLRRYDEASSVLEEYVQQGGDPEAGQELQCMLKDSEGMLWPADSEQEGDGSPSGEEVEGVTLPKRISGSPPRYPESARLMGLQARVLLWAKINREGRVECVLPMGRSPFGFAEEAVTAVKGWKYEPAMKGGKPLPILFTVVVSFHLED